MKKSDAIESQSASELISKKIADVGDWRGKTLARMRKLVAAFFVRNAFVLIALSAIQLAAFLN